MASRGYSALSKNKFVSVHVFLIALASLVMDHRL